MISQGGEKFYHELKNYAYQKQHFDLCNNRPSREFYKVNQKIVNLKIENEIAGSVIDEPLGPKAEICAILWSFKQKLSTKTTQKTFPINIGTEKNWSMTFTENSREPENHS